MNSTGIAEMRMLFRNIDPKAKIWAIGDKTSPYLTGTIDFDGNNFGVSVIDQFSGKQPLLMSRDTLDGETKIAFHPTYVLDSNIVSCLHEYRTKSSYRKSEAGLVVRKVLEKFIETGFDYNPVFYFTEAAAKNDADKLWPFAKEMAETMFAFHSMNEAHFLATDEIINDEEAVEHYLERFGVSDASEIPDAFLRSTIFAANRPDLQSSCDSIYAALLKMIEIQLSSRASVPEKLEQLNIFFINELGAQMAREFLIAADYFSGNCDKFIPVKPNSKWVNQRPKLMASAWDILLLRIPELLLAAGDQSEATLAYICTAEKSLRSIGKLFSIKAISCMPPDVTVPIPIIEYDFSRVEEKFGKQITARIAQVATSAMNMTPKAQRQATVPKTPLPQLVSALEERVRGFCT